MNIILAIILALFLTGFFGDIGTQLVAQVQPTVNLFSPYWEMYGRLPGAIVAGFITLFFGGVFLLIAMGIFKALNLELKSWSFVLFSTALAFVLGVLADVWANYGDWFGAALRKWYDGMGATNASMWSGGFAFALTVFVASMVYVTTS